MRLQFNGEQMHSALRVWSMLTMCFYFIFENTFISLWFIDFRRSHLKQSSPRRRRPGPKTTHCALPLVITTFKLNIFCQMWPEHGLNRIKSVYWAENHHDGTSLVGVFFVLVLYDLFSILYMMMFASNVGTSKRH